MMNDPSILAGIKDVNELNTIKNQAIVQLMSQGISQEKANDLLNQSQSGMIDENGIRIFILETITVQVSAGIIVPNAKEGQARFGQEQLDIDATSNIVIDAVTKMGQIKQKVDQRIVDSNINPQYVGLALGLVLGGPANLVKSVAVDQFFGDEITEITDQVKSNGTAYLLNTDSETVNNTLNNKALINQTGNETAKQLLNQIEWMKEGVGIASSIVLGATGGVVSGKVGKVNSADNQVSEEVLALNRIKENNKGNDLSNKSSDTVINQQASKRVDQVTAPIDFDGHILSAEVKPNGSVVGGHSTATGNVKVLQVIGKPDKNGVYQARVAVSDKSGQYVNKTNNGGVSTMFPDSWSADRLKVEVDAAYKNRQPVPNKPNMWQGKTPSGGEVTGYLQPKTTVYPKPPMQ